MIVYFSVSISEIQKLSRPVIGQMIHRLVHLGSSGNHLLIMPRKTCLFLINRTNNEFEIAVLNKIRNNFAQYAGLVSQRISYLEIGDPEKSGLEASVVLPLSYLLEGGLDQPTVLIVENMTRDGPAYEFIADCTRRVSRVPRYSLRLAHGGGADLKDCLTHMRKERGIYVALIDSDKKTPFDRDGEKFTALIRAATELALGISAVYQTPTHELENLLTLREIMELPQWQSNGDASKFLPFYEDWCIGENCDYEFLDLKDGFDSEKLKRNHPEAAEWVDAMVKRCGHKTISGFGDKILISLSESGRAKAEFHKTIRSDRWQKRFGIFFGTVLDWMVASEKFRAA